MSCGLAMLFSAMGGACLGFLIYSMFKVGSDADHRP